VDGEPNVAALFYNHEDRLEAVQHGGHAEGTTYGYLTKGFVCYSDMGRILLLRSLRYLRMARYRCGVSNAVQVADKYGTTRFQEHRTVTTRNGYDSFLNELSKYGLGKRDIVPNVNFFSKVTVGHEGQLYFRPGGSKPGDHVERAVRKCTRWWY